MPPARLRAPREHRGIFALPPLDQAEDLLAANQIRLSQPIRFLDRPLGELRALCQAEARRSAEAHLGCLGLTSLKTASEKWIVSGHQPDLFHPGVWVKNFAAFGLAQRHGLTPLHLIVDHDTLKSTSIRVPVPSSQPMRTVSVPFDAPADPTPWEERTVSDEELLARFPAEVAAQITGVRFEPLLPRLWEHVGRLNSPMLATRLAGARRRLEGDWGCHSLELPMSALCRGEAFAWFVGHLLTHLPRFQAIHNQCLLQHRRARGIRSRNHPVPELAADGDWIEAPFWVWRTENTERRRVFVRLRSESLDVRFRPNVWAEIPRHGPPETLVAGLRELEAHGYKIRPRALTTTLFARLFLADLFIHGIGGAIYDELNDQIIRAFFGMEPPAFLTLSATMHLPLIPWHGAAENEGRVRRRLRDLEWNPQRYLPTLEGPQAARSLLREKERLIAWLPTSAAERRQRFHELRRVTGALLPHVKTQRRLLETTAARLGQLTQTEMIARDRNYAFCLFPETEMREFMARFL